MKNIYLMALVPGALIYWGLTRHENLWDLLFQGHIGTIVNILLHILIVSVFIFAYGLIVEVTGPHVIKTDKKE